nr:uncharacterized protein LOC109729402 [Microcebus murinus]
MKVRGESAAPTSACRLPGFSPRDRMGSKDGSDLCRPQPPVSPPSRLTHLENLVHHRQKPWSRADSLTLEVSAPSCTWSPNALSCLSKKTLAFVAFVLSRAGLRREELVRERGKSRGPRAKCTEDGDSGIWARLLGEKLLKGVFLAKPSSSHSPEASCSLALPHLPSSVPTISQQAWGGEGKQARGEGPSIINKQELFRGMERAHTLC